MTKRSLYRSQTPESAPRAEYPALEAESQYTRESGRQARRPVMSARNGDKSRYQVNRKRAVLRRTKIRELVRAVKGGPAQPAKAQAK